MQDKIIAIVKDILSLSLESLSLNSSYENTEGWTSLRHMEIVYAIEEEFGVQFTDEQIVGFENIGSILEAVEKQLETNNQDL